MSANPTVSLSRRSQIAPFLAMDVMEQARMVAESGRDVVHMEVGQPGTPAPKAAAERVAAAMRSGDPMGYTVALGRPDLRAGIADLYRKRHGVEIDPARVVITSGSSCGFILAFLSLFDAGARVALADPGYPAYRNILGALDLEVARIETHLDTGFQPTPAHLEQAGDLAGLLVASPANPTGTMLSREALRDLIDYCGDRGITFISDEIYHGLTYGAPAVSALEFSDNAIIINSFAKYFSMTGWRVGWMIVPESMIRTIEALAQNLFICAPHVSQVAALGALEAEAELEAHKAVYAANRERLLGALPGMGFTDIAPADGAFYVYANLTQLSNDSRNFCSKLLQEGGVAATPGLDFDPVRGHGTLRFSFARTEAEIAEGIERIGRFLS
ncbi:MAG: aminotransferase class I/II-fold pyridoxal phosphate-dependent enzyme [Pseudomonadota bacterium]